MKHAETPADYHAWAIAGAHVADGPAAAALLLLRDSSSAKPERCRHAETDVTQERLCSMSGETA
jgi:hypothetical protein